MKDSEWTGSCFNDRLNLVKENYYNLYYPGDVCSVGYHGNTIHLFGVGFIFDLESETYSLVEKNFTSIELVCVASNFSRYFESINRY